jgi:toxin FitB
MFLLDTNVLSELRKHHKAHPHVIAWFAAMSSDLLYISPIIVAEIELGVKSIERRDKAQGLLLRKWANGVFAEFRDRSLAIDIETARIYASLQVPDKRPERDAWIAASALQAGFKVVTRNVADFAPMKVAVVNPWD